MKQLFLVLLFCVVYAGTAISQSKLTVSVDKAVHDFGKINEEDGDVSCEFVLKNTGDSPLVISRVTASCGCTTPDWTKSPITPGQEGRVKVTYSTKNRPGPFSKSITVYTNATPNVHGFSIKGEVIPKAQNPEVSFPIVMGELRLKRSTAVFHSVKNTEVRNDFIEVFNSSASPVKITFANVPNYLTLVASPQELEAGKTGLINIVYDGRKSKNFGYYTDVVNLELNGKTSASNQSFNIVSSVVDDFSKMTATERNNAPILAVAPGALTFTNLPTTKTADLTLSNKGKSTLVIYSIQSSTPDILSVHSGRKEIKPGKSLVVKASVDAPKITRNTSSYIHLATNDPNAPIKAVRAIISTPTK